METSHSVRKATRQEKREEHAERVGVRRGRGVFPVELFRTCKCKGKRPLAGAGKGGFGAGTQKLGDAEVKKLRLALCGHKDVFRFEIAMDDEIPMGIRHCATNFPEEF